MAEVEVSVLPSIHCLNTVEHASHPFSDNVGIRWQCPGHPHDHSSCCAEHDWHTNPHRSCILR